MRIDIQARGFALTPALRGHAERRLRLALGGAGAHVTFLAVRLGDENGPRSGMDKRCSIRALIPGASPVVVDEVDCDLYAAIDRAVSRAGRAVLRRIARSHSIRRTAPPAGSGDDRTLHHR